MSPDGNNLFASHAEPRTTNDAMASPNNAVFKNQDMPKSGAKKIRNKIKNKANQIYGDGYYSTSYIFIFFFFSKKEYVYYYFGE